MASKRSHLSSVFSVAMLLAASEAGRAAHPFITDDAGTQGAGKWQLELLGERARHDRVADPGGGPVQQSGKTTSFSPVLTYGVLDNLDVALGFNYTRFRITENGATTEAANGVGDATLELKWRFYEEGPFSVALKPGLLLPAGNENRGLGAGRASWGVNLIADYDAEPWVFLANVAYAHARFRLPQDQADNRRDLWRVSAGVEYVVAKQLRLVGELGVRTNPARNDPFFPERHGQFAMLGAIYSPTENIDFDIGLRKALNRGESDSFLIGATFRW